jgi:hypothetical protein
MNRVKEVRLRLLNLVFSELECNIEPLNEDIVYEDIDINTAVIEQSSISEEEILESQKVLENLANTINCEINKKPVNSFQPCYDCLYEEIKCKIEYNRRFSEANTIVYTDYSCSEENSIISFTTSEDVNEYSIISIDDNDSDYGYNTNIVSCINIKLIECEVDDDE